MNEKEIMQYYKDCRFIFDYYGMENQKRQMVQELAELIQAITKNDPANFMEELADVQIMIDQFLISNHAVDLEVQRIQSEKIKRQLHRIKEERNNENKTRDTRAA